MTEEDAIRELSNFEEWLGESTHDFVELLANTACENARTGFAGAEYDGTNDAVCMTAGEGTDYDVIAFGKSVLFIEFGTGIKYPDDHPEAAENGMVRGGYGNGFGKSEFGWTYTGDPGTHGYFIEAGPQAGRIHTYGNPANAPMYHAGELVRNGSMDGNFLKGMFDYD